jgi:hypothetical protein
VLRLDPCPPLFSGAVSAFSLPPPLSMFNYSSLFVIQCCYCVYGNQSVQGLYWFMFLGVSRGVLHGVWCSPVCSVN